MHYTGCPIGSGYERHAAKALCDEAASLREVAAVAEQERANAEQEIERARERISVLERSERDLMCTLEEQWAAYDESSHEWVSLTYMRARCTCGALNALPSASSEA